MVVVYLTEWSNLGLPHPLRCNITLIQKKWINLPLLIKNQRGCHHPHQVRNCATIVSLEENLQEKFLQLSIRTRNRLALTLLLIVQYRTIIRFYWRSHNKLMRVWWKICPQQSLNPVKFPQERLVREAVAHQRLLYLLHPRSRLSSLLRIPSRAVQALDTYHRN